VYGLGVSGTRYWSWHRDEAVRHVCSTLIFLLMLLLGCRAEATDVYPVCTGNLIFGSGNPASIHCSVAITFRSAAGLLASDKLGVCPASGSTPGGGPVWMAAGPI